MAREKDILGRLPDKPPDLPPVDDVLRMRGQGMPHDEILSRLEQQNFDNRQINDAINQADIKASIRPSYSDQAALRQLEESAPSPGQDLQPSALPYDEPQEPQASYQEPFLQPATQFPANARQIEEQIEELVEAVVGEKWDELTADIGDIAAWKENVKTEITSIKQEILRFEQRFENVQRAVLGRVSDYNKSIMNIGSEIKALEQVFQKILTPLTSNIKELERITTKLQGTRSTKPKIHQPKKAKKRKKKR